MPLWGGDDGGKVPLWGRDDGVERAGGRYELRLRGMGAADVGEDQGAGMTSRNPGGRGVRVGIALGKPEMRN